MFKAACVLLLLLANQLAATTASAETRVALVIGNAGYQHAKTLKTPKADAIAIATLLKSLGFRVFGDSAKTDLSAADMASLVSEFGAEAREADEAVVYFAGYGVVSNRTDYLVAVDADVTAEASLIERSIPLDMLLRVVSPQQGRLTVLLDAAYENPLLSAPRTTGLVLPTVAGKVTVALAAEPGKIAAKGSKQSPFVTALLAQLPLTGGDVVAALTPTAKKVVVLTAGRQKPVFSSRFEIAAASARTVARPAPAASAPDATVTSRDIVAAPPPVSGPEFHVVRVYYATDRKPTGQTTPNDMYGGDRGNMVYGLCDVSIPLGHQPGELEEPKWTHFEFSEDPKKHVVLMMATEVAADTYFKSVAESIAEHPGHNAFIFVHGFNVSFKDAARRTAQMAWDLKFDGAPVFFSWPSQASPTKAAYIIDENAVQYGQDDLKQFIKDFVEKSPADHIYLIAHSMGNRALAGALGDLFASNPEIKSKIKEVLLTAPDIDAQVFRRNIAPKIVDKGALVSMYVSSNDWALYFSRTVAGGYPRIGEFGTNPTLVPGVTTIDATDVDTDLLGHLYYAESTSVISDWKAIFDGHTNPDDRTSLLQKKDVPPDGHYWHMIGGAQ